jgi:hypothetical protein
MSTQPKNARFWAYTNTCGLVKLTVRPEQTLRHSLTRWNGEGWETTVNTYSHDGEEIVRGYHNAGRDCDGRFASGDVLRASIDQLQAADMYDAPPGIRQPVWRSDARNRWQRDYSAEAAGY